MDELEATKAQLARALSVTSELEAVHEKNRKLMSEIGDANQRCESLQSRLKISQARCATLEEREREMRDELEKARKESDDLRRKCADLEAQKREAKEEADDAQKERDARDQFFEKVGGIVGAKAADYEAVLKLVAALERQKESECGQCKESEAVIQRLLEKMQKLKGQLNQACEELQQKSETLSVIATKVGNSENIVEAIDALKEERFAVEEEVKELKAEMERMKADVAAKDERIEAMRKRALEPVVVEKEEDKTEVFQAQIEGLEAQKGKLEEEAKEKDAKIEELQVSVEKLNRKLKNGKERERSQVKEMRHLQKQKKNCRTQLSELQLTVSEYKTQLTSMQSQIEASQLQEPEKKIDEVVREKEKLKKAYHMVVAQMKLQRKEIEVLEKERQKLVALLQKQNQAFGALTRLANEQAEQIKKMTAKPVVLKEIKTVSARDLAAQAHLDMIREALLPRLDGVMKKDIENVLQVASSGEDEVVRKIYGLIAELIATMKNKIAAKKEKIAALKNKKCEKCQTLQSVLRRVLDGFHEAQAYPGDDPVSAAIKSGIKMIEETVGSADSASARSEMAGQLSQMMVNVVLSAKMKVMGDELEGYKNELASVMELLNCRSQDIVPIIKRLKSKLRKQKRRKAVITEGKPCPEKQVDSQTAPLITVIEQQKQEVQRLSSELTVKAKLLETATAHNNSLQEKLDAMQKSRNDEAAQYEKAIDSRNKSCLELAQKLSQLEGKNKGLHFKISQLEAEFAKLLAEEKKKHEQELNKMSEEIQDVKRTAVNRYQNQKQKYESRLCKLKQRYEDAQRTTECTTDSARRQVEDIQQMYAHLQASLEETKDANAQLTRKLTKARRNLTALAATVQRQKEQGERDLKVAEAQHACQIMQLQSQHHEDLIALRKDLESKTEDLKINVLDAFNVLDSFEQREIDDKSFDLAIRRIARSVELSKGK